MDNSPTRRQLHFLFLVLMVLMLSACSTPIAAQPPSVEPPPLTPRPGRQPRVTATPTQVISPLAQVALPTPTATLTVTVAPTTAPGLVLLHTPTPSPTRPPVPAITPSSAPRPQQDTLRAEGSFFTQTRFADGVTTQQQGSFTLLRVVVDNAYAANQRVTLTTRRADGLGETITVYEIDDYIAIGYAEDDWVVLSRDQGSSIVKAIQPIHDLALALPAILAQGTFIQAEEVAGLPTLRYRLNDVSRLGPALIRPLLAADGSIRSLNLDAWFHLETATIVRYSFQLELDAARVFDAAFNEVLADQSVTWTYQVATPDVAAATLTWPAAAPNPDRLDVPGFAAGAFPLPPDSRLVSVIADVPEWQTPAPLDEVAGFYRRVLSAGGWQVEGEAGYLQAGNEGESLIILLTEDLSRAGELPATHISVLSAP